jgi:hypothetical protein
MDSIAPADSVMINNLKKVNIAVEPIALGSNFLEVNAINTPTFGDKDAAKIGKIAPQIRWLMLSETQITDASLDNFLGCENLEKMNLKNTSISNASITKINKLKKISYLNIVGTKITDAGLLQLTPAQEDIQIYCWNTAITENGIKEPQIDFTDEAVKTGARFRVALIQEGLGNLRDGFYYTKQALESAVPAFEGKKAYADHPSRSEESDRPERSVRDIVGHYENLKLEIKNRVADVCSD